MGSDLLGLDSRRRLYRHIESHPGKYLRELQRDLGMAMGSLEHHLRQLEKGGMVTCWQGNNKRFFAADIDRRDRPRLALLRQELPRRVLVIALDRGLLSKAELMGVLRVPRSTLNYHLAALVRAELLIVGRRGRHTVYRVSDEENAKRLLIAYQASWLDRIVDSFLDGTGAMR